MKQVFSLLLVALAPVIAFAIFNGGGSDESDPLQPIRNMTAYHCKIKVVLPNGSVSWDQVRNGIDTVYLLQDAKTVHLLCILTVRI